MTEDIRLVIWDLDETFWKGTLTEGGITVRPEIGRMVIELARRGIVSSICSKNDESVVREVLENMDVWDYFVLPSINWEPKGPRIAQLIATMQLRPPAVMFIDDNPADLNEALYYAPGLQISTEAILEHLLDDPRFNGSNDLTFKMLNQYRLLPKREQDEKKAGANVDNYLRASGITVELNYDIEPHIDRAIELINRTNQLNFTKRRLPEDIETAKAEFLHLIRGYNVHAALVRVRDNYCDHGYVGLYVTLLIGKELGHFCFSCRILGMGIETWLYNKIGRPRLNVIGKVLTDVIGDKRAKDWIKTKSPAANSGAGPGDLSGNKIGSTIFARGGCALAATMHYCGQHADKLMAEYYAFRDGVAARTDHSMFLRAAIDRLQYDTSPIFSLLGYKPEDLKTRLFEVRGGRQVWLMSFWQESEVALYKHRETGVLVPFRLPGISGRLDATKKESSDLKEEFRGRWIVSALRNLKGNFDYFGLITENMFKENLAAVLDARSPSTQFCVVGQNDYVFLKETSEKKVDSRCNDINRWIFDVISNYDNTHLIYIRDLIQDEMEVHDRNHFDRIVYYRLYQWVAQVMRDQLRVAA